MSVETSSTNLAAPWRFRDGTEYLVSIGLNDRPKWVSLSLSDKITAEEWSGQFDLTYIENLTQRTGNYKPFDTFVAMIKCAVLKKSDSVTLELMSYEDLVALRNQKKKSGTASSTMKDLNLGPNLTKFDSSSDAEFNRGQTQGSKHPNKYLIITYVAEFDKVHYPLPLKYTGYPDAIAMQQTIQKLKTEVACLRNTNADLITQLKAALKPSYGKHPRSALNRSGSSSDDYENRENSETESSSGSDPSFEMKPYPLGKYRKGNGSQSEKLQGLAHVVKNLEARIDDERNGHQDKLSKLEAENESLRNKLKTIEASEYVLKEKVSRLESVLAINVGIKKTKYSAGFEQAVECELTHKPSYLLRSSSSNRNNERPPGRRGNLNLNMPGSRNLSRSSRCSSLASKSSKQDCQGNNINTSSQHRRLSMASAGSRQSSCERKPFNPTEYVQKKKQKQEQMAIMRLARVETRIHSSHDQEVGRKSNARHEEMSPAISRALIKSRESRLGGSNRESSSNLKARLSRQLSLERRPYKSNANTAARQASPSPVRQSLLEPSKAAGRPSRRKIRDNLTKTTARASLDGLLNNEMKGRFETADVSSRNPGKIKFAKSGRNVREPRNADSSLSFDKLQKRLHTIHAFLEMNKKS
ncbi:unnamed protein product [Allacma fusca]|uniref:Coiled-coil domain-containing protein 61 n=1 Tax=Allacma fusca TaxID=39272 RepID=A0A8J2NVN5_9HEXA|nr:unnamed protein product [Allacma fusca]